MGLLLKRPPRFSPRTPRSAVYFGACLVLEDERVVPVTVRNLSPEGFMASCSIALPPRTWLGIELPGYGIVRAWVRWCEADELGCQFRAPIDLDRLKRCLTAQDQPAGLFRAAAREHWGLAREAESGLTRF